MKPTNAIIPAGQVVALLTTAGCAPDAVPGDWTATHYTYQSQEFDLAEPMYVMDDGSYSIEVRAGIDMTIDEAGAGSFVITQSFIRDDERVRDDTYTYALTGEPISRSEWDVRIPELELAMTCFADGDWMFCDGYDDSGSSYQIEFTRN